MLIEETFEKDIRRRIDAVVKANDDDEAHLKDELEEFVLTAEVEQYLSIFYDEYQDRDSRANGVWISGFFGSGKSHLLKILAVILANREVAGQSAVDYILPKLRHNSMLAGQMARAGESIRSESVLFNVDAFAPNQGRSESGALLAAFIKAFNRHCGYFDGDQQHLARLEYDLDREGRLEAFREAVEAKCGKPWNEIRTRAALMGSKVTAAFDEVCGNEPGTTPNVLTYYKESYKPDIRSFAQRVREYIDSRGEGFRLNFFVDEVGQFIAGNTGLMVNLQSVAEELNTACEGRAWVFVTSQEDIDTVIGDRDARSAQDFSKIQGRFKIRMNLTSQASKTVIRDRLLAKKPEARADVARLHAEFAGDFGVFFDFADGMRKYEGYQGEDDFVAAYPFVPYQFELFINAMRELSKHNAFQGRHSSVGARSMLSVFQQVAIELCDRKAPVEEGELASFDMMFEGLRGELRSEVYAVISSAESSLENPLAVRLLKALLLVKYIEEFRATPGNLRVLMCRGLRENTAVALEDVRGALGELEKQNYVRREGDSFSYLTDDERDIEKEIRETAVPDAKRLALLDELLTEVLGASKVAYSPREGCVVPFPYDLKIDGESRGRSRNDLTVDIVTDYDESEVLYGAAMGAPAKTLRVGLRKSADFFREVGDFLRASQYVAAANPASAERKAILTRRRDSLQLQRKNLAGGLASLLSEAVFDAAGQDVTPPTSKIGGASAVEHGLLKLIAVSYPHLQQVSANPSGQEIYDQAIETVENQLGVDSQLPEYCASVLARIRQMEGRTAVTVTGDGQGALAPYFLKGEYGWPSEVVRSAVARLYAAGLIKVKVNGKPAGKREFADALKAGRGLEKFIIETDRPLDEEEMSKLQEAYRLLTGEMVPAGDSKLLAVRIAQTLAKKLDEVQLDRVNEYPFGGAYEHARKVLAEAARKAEDEDWALRELPAQAAAVAEAANSLVKMASFGKGKTGALWHELDGFLMTAPDKLRYLGLDDSGLTVIEEAVHDERCYESNLIPKAVKTMKGLRRSIADETARRRAKALEDFKAYEETFLASECAPECGEKERAEIARIFADGRQKLEGEENPMILSSFMETFKQRELAGLLALAKPVRPEPAPEGDAHGGQSSVAASEVEPGAGGESTVAEPAVAAPAARPRLVQMSTMTRTPGYAKTTIASPQDAEEFLAALRAEILAALERGETIAR